MSEAEGPDRDDRASAYAARCSAAADARYWAAKSWGGALRRMTVGGVAPSWEDEHRFVSVPGRYVPIGFARYVAPVVDPTDYEYYRLGGWRVAVPRNIPGNRVKELLYRIYTYGPQSAGYVRYGADLVPAILDSGDRMTLGESAVDYESYPLSP